MVKIYASDFEYDNAKLSDYGFTICQFESSGGVDIVNPGSAITFNQIPTHNGRVYPLISTQYDECLSCIFDICKITDDCNVSNSDEISLSEERMIFRWLNRHRFLKFRFVSETDDVVWYMASFNIEEIRINDKLYGLRLTMTTDKPFGYGKQVSISGNGSASPKTVSFDCSGDEEGYQDFDSITLTTTTAGDYYIRCTKVDGSTKDTVIKNCIADETIVIDCKNKIITTNKSTHQIYNDFNYIFPFLTRKWVAGENKATSNSIKIGVQGKTSATFSYDIRYTPVIKGFSSDIDDNGTVDPTPDGSEDKTVDVSTGEPIPSYWLTYLQTKADEIHEVMEAAGRNKSAFLFYTDAHWDYGSKKAPMLLKYLYNNTPINKTIFGGDIVNSESSNRDDMKYLWEWRKQVRELPNHHSVVGNHDDGATPNNRFSTNYIYSFLLAAEENQNVVQGGDMYYYIDEPCEKTRYLYLDTAYIGISSTSSQMAFVKEALKTAPDNWHIVAISHIWYEPDYDKYNVRPIPIKGYGAGVGDLVNLFDKYNARQDDEFSGCTAKVEFCIGGHCHRDYVGRSTNGIPIILCETDSHHNRSGLTDTVSTTAESSVNAIIADYGTKKVNIIRVGRGKNFEVSLYGSDIPNVPDLSYTPVVPDTPDKPDIPDPPETSYTNLIPTAIDMNGNVYNNSGYKAGTYIDNTDGLTEVSQPSYWCTGLIPITKGDVVRIKYVFNKSTYNDPNNHYYSHLCFYNADKSFNRFKYLDDFLNNFISGDYEWSGTNFEGTLTFTFDGTSSMFNNAKYIRVSSAYLGNSANVQTSIENAVITINEEIN